MSDDKKEMLWAALEESEDGRTAIEKEIARILSRPAERDRIVRRLAKRYIENAWDATIRAAVDALLPAHASAIVQRVLNESHLYGVRNIIEDRIARFVRKRIRVVVRKRKRPTP